MASDILTAEIGRVHYNDLLRQFAVVVSFQLKTPLGNFPHKEVTFTAENMFEAVNFIINTWSGAGLAEGIRLNFPLGDPAELLASITAINATATIELQTLPTVPGNNEGPDDGIDVYTGDFGITTP